MLNSNKAAAVNRSSRDNQKGEPAPCQPDLHGASIVTASGQEVPITEAMIQESLAVFIRAWERDQKNQHKTGTN